MPYSEITKLTIIFPFQLSVTTSRPLKATKHFDYFRTELITIKHSTRKGVKSVNIIRIF
jgi:hypothetical protein